MSKILDNLYIASFEETFKDDEMLSQVTHILNVASELMINKRVNHEYRKIGINDDDRNCDIRSILLDSINWIDKALSEGGSVCVHCLEGKSRSVCVCIAYLCCKLGWEFEDAYEWVKQQRPCIDIFPLYFQQLKLYVTGN